MLLSFYLIPTFFYYPAACKAKPTAPEVRGQTASMKRMMDADHTGCCLTRRSHTDGLIFVNGAPIHWFSKQQRITIEASIFVAEFIAAKLQWR
jgi:hypothetical protein